MVSYSCVIFKKKKLNHQQLLLHSVIGTFKGKNRGKEEEKALFHQDNVLCYKSMKTMAMVNAETSLPRLVIIM